MSPALPRTARDELRKARGHRQVRCGRLVRAARQRKRLGQTELAVRAGTSQAAISQIERDQVSPTLETLNRIFEAMGETLNVSTVSLDRRPSRGGNQTIRELRANYRDLSAEERLAQAAELSRLATELAAQAREDDGPGK